MAVFNAAKREIDLKIVYYGPALCGKTTNVQVIHKKLNPDQRGEMMSLATKDDRTLFFDFLPIELGNVKGFKTRFHLYTVPGQVYYALTRRAVLTGVDGVVFVADSQREKLDENLESLKDLEDNLKFYKKDYSKVPFIIQFNKRDMDDIMSVEELDSALNPLKVPCFEACAVTGQGVMETLTGCCKLILKNMDKGSEQKKKSRVVRPAAQKPEASPEEEPIIKITSDEAVAESPTSEPAPAVEPVIPAEEPSQEPVISETAASFDNNIPELKIDSSDFTTEPDEPVVTFDDRNEEPLISEQVPSLSLDETPPLPVDDAAAPDEAPPAGIQVEPGAGLKLVACGQPQKETDTSIKIPMIFEIEQLGKEFKLNVKISLDDFTLK